MIPKYQFEQTVKLDVEARDQEGVKAVLEEVLEEERPNTSRLATGSLPRPGEESARVTTIAIC